MREIVIDFQPLCRPGPGPDLRRKKASTRPSPYMGRGSDARCDVSRAVLTLVFANGVWGTFALPGCIGTRHTCRQCQYVLVNVCRFEDSTEIVGA